MRKVAHLHFHTEHSLQDSIIQINKLPELIEKKGVKAIALTDHGTVDGAVKFYLATKDIEGFNPLLGCEFYVVDNHLEKRDRRRYHLTVIAKNMKGFRSIMKALTVANLEGFYYKPRVSWKYLLENLTDVVVLSGCIDGFLSYPKEKRELMLADFLEKFGEDFYLESMLLRDYKPYYERNKLIYSLHKKWDLPVVFTNDVHYPNKEDWTAREIAFAIRVNRNVNAKTYNIPPEGSTTDLYLKTYDEMVDSLDKTPFKGYENEMVRVWDEIIEKTKGDWLRQQKVSVPVAFSEAKNDPKKFLNDWCWQEFEKRKEEFLDVDKAKERLEKELSEICGLGFAEYFLLVADMIHAAKQRDIMVGIGRGTVGASLVAYLIGITGVNPLNYDLIFERFISPGRHDLPDIDIDFEDTRRDEIIEYLKEKYGEEKVALVSTHMSMKGRGALRDAGRVFGVPLSEVDAAAKQILVRSGGDARADFSIQDTMGLFEVAKAFKRKYPEVVKEAEKLEGLLKTKGVHAAGVVVDIESLYTGKKCSLERSKSEDVAVNWDKYDLEYMGLMKIDILGLKTLSILHEIKNMVKERRGVDIVWEKLIPLPEEGDPKIIKLFQEGNTVGVFQFGSPGMIQYLRNFKPVNFKELYQVNALFRPGTLRSGMATQFILNRRNPEKVEYINEELKEILKDTYGIVLFQEQIMYILNKLGDIPWRTADMIRKVVSKSQGQEKFESFRKQFLDGVRRIKSMNESDANKIFSLMKFFGSYGFNLAHSVEYTILGYWTAWAKVYYPLEFYCANLMKETQNTEISTLLDDIQRNTNFKILLPDIHKSDVSWKIEDDNSLRAGFSIIKGISTKLAEVLVEKRKEVGGSWKGFRHFYNTIPRRQLNISRIKALLLANVFGDWFTEEERKRLLIYIEENKRVPENFEELKKIDISKYDEMPFRGEKIFNYELAQAFFDQNEGLVKLVKGSLERQKRRFIELCEIEGEEILDEVWLIGKFDELKYGYRSSVDKKKDTLDTRGYADDLGGVYGIFRDKSALNYATITKDLYYRKDMKSRIENIAGKHILVKADKPTRASNIFVHEIYFFDDIKEGTLNNCEIFRGAIEFGKLDCNKLREEIRSCSLCDARKECRAPVPFTEGKCNAMIIGRDPGSDEDKQGVPFVGASGKLLWDVFSRVSGLERDWFYVTNLQKCCPSNNQYNDRTSQFCRKNWLSKELKVVNPVLILGLGSKVCQFLSDDKNFKISEMAGKAVWSEKFKAWVVYSLHPASFLYGRQQDISPLESAIRKFTEIFLDLAE